ncbi:HAMP domain-containing sensor histidine kinase [Devosia sp.]|uniref:HAMP domain-containing sensor histidine kinase n=1 Tax=Devosia sp. TaxID=1871048 RepID=UPI002AFF5F27|nr:HAMP domain-containing sensor histidine kinase [Devosia sp.]
MDAEWSTSPSARRVLQHEGDPRPAWLWSQDGQALLWRNQAANLFLAKLKKHGLKRAHPAVPIKGQVARSIRLGALGRTSLARIQFLAGDKPVSSTCATTPLVWKDGQTALLIVGVDAIAADILDAAPQEGPPSAAPEAQPPATEDSIYQRELESWREAEQEGMPGYAGADAPAPEAEPASNRLSLLVDRLAAHDALFTPLNQADEPPAQPEAEEEAEAAEPGQETEPAEAPTLYRVTGRGFVADRQEESPPAAPEPPPEPETTSPEAVERISRYNFDELARILTDRVGEVQARPAPPPAPTPASGGALINLGGETLVLNRLPLGILVFRDQQVLFANRAITEMVGYDSVENLRRAGLAAVFPAAGPDNQEAGPVNHLVQRDGTLVPVTARLQSISWQGRPALMLSASTTEVRTSHEGAVAAFAQNLAASSNEGFLQATRTGIISTITPRAVALLGIEGLAEGKALSAVIAGEAVAPLRAFLERPARFAETERPHIVLHAANGSADIILFAQGQAGVITGYFGLVRGLRALPPARIAGPAESDPGLLARISRGVRRPLNTIIGFADLMRSQAFGDLRNERYESYALDIATAGHEIAALVDELDDYARLREGRYLPQRASLDLTSLLESCLRRVRPQANGARVIMRNAISENLPRVTADQPSLAQAVLNLLASAIDQTPAGGAVVISAQREDDNGIAVHVRDSSAHAVDMAERFVVFRDGVNRAGEPVGPVRSSVGLALTRSLLAVNGFSLTVDPAGKEGMLFTLHIPTDAIAAPQALPETR